MKLDAATLAVVLSTMAIGMVVWSIPINLEQAAQIRRLEISTRALCGVGSPNHHTKACAEISLPLVYPPSPFVALIPNRDK